MRLGNASLIVAVSGLVGSEVALRLHWIAGPVWTVVARAFEAATVGGVADWFAVTALFREVPLPVIRRHTNIIAKNRDRIVSGIVDMVQNRWLSAASVREHLSRFSVSNYLLDRLSDSSNAAIPVSFLQKLVRSLGRSVGRPEVSAYLDRVFRDELQSFDIAAPLGRWIATAVRRGDHLGLWDTVVEGLDAAVHGRKMRRAIEKRVDGAIEDYAESRYLGRFALSAVDFFGIATRDGVVDVILQKMDEFVEEMRNESHPLRTELDSIVLGFGEAMASGHPEAVYTVDRLRSALIKDADLGPYISKAVSELSETVASQISTPGSDIDQLVRRIFKDVVEGLRQDEGARAAIDQWFQQLVTQELERGGHGEIGAIVRKNLEKLSDSDLVSQIEGKVGSDLQYIRVNGAVVGGLVGAVIGAVRLLT